ncbi:MAG: RidA family protein [Campylobacteraceae bacterium]|jgi:2-iminobutanoate/2-iminopropanoate deaminase|nr:RidA family protein [Campylobacteraceae bacterium]
MKTISTKKAPEAIGPYSQAVTANGFIFTSGQIALTNEGKFLDEDIKVQTEQVLKNLSEILKQGGSSLEKVVKTTIFLTDINDFAVVNEIYAKAFGAHKPARSTVSVKSLPKNAKIEIEAVAVV